MPDESRNYAPAMTNAVTVSSGATPYGFITLAEHQYKSGPCILSIKKVSGAGTPAFNIVEAADGANLRTLKNHVTGSVYTVSENEAVQLPFAPKTIGVFSGTGGTWSVEVRLHF